MSGKICAVSGHRPEKLPWGDDATDSRCVALKQLMKETLRTLCDQGYDTFLCGMARGVDQYFAEIILELKEEYPLSLEAIIPCKSQPDGWREDVRREYLKMLARCDKVTYVQEKYSEGCMLRRNRFMVEHTDLLLTVFDGSRGGTAATVRYAESRGVEILPLWR